MTRLRLWQQIWLGTMITGLGVMVALGLAWHFEDRTARLPPVVVSALAGLFDDPARLDAHAKDQGLALTWWGRDGSVRAAAPTDTAPTDVPVGAHRTGLVWTRSGPGVLVALPDGEQGLVVLDAPTHPMMRVHHLFVFTSVALVLAAGAWAMARVITRRLGRLDAAASAWERGDLGARSRVEGADEVADLSRRFDAAADRIEASVARERRLLAHASHEFRAPLTRLRVALEILDDGGPTTAQATADVEALDRLVGDTLAAARGQAGLPRRARHDLRTLVSEAAGDALRAGPPVTASVDADLVRRAVANLVHNAARYGRGAVAVSIETIDGRILVHVDDDGAPLPEAWRPHLFEPFWQAPGHAESDGGVGLGLSLVASIATAHGGEARYLVGPHGGSRFTMDLGAADGA